MKRKIFSKLLMGAFLIASVSMFVSCKDYDDDIQKNAQDIAALKAALGTDINAAKSDLTAQLAAAKSELQNAIDKAVAAKANQSDLDKTNAELEALKKDVTDLAGKVSALEAQLAALEGIEGDLAKLSDALAGKADAEKLSELEGKLAAITGDMKDFITKEDAEAIAAAAVATLDNQLKAFEAYEARIKDLEGKVLDNAEVEALAKEVADLKEKLSKIDVDEAVKKLDEKVEEAIKELQDKFQPMSEEITKVNDSLDAFKLFVMKKLTSVVLKPGFYWEGIEGIELPFVKTAQFEPVANYKFSYAVTDDAGTILGDQVVDVTVDTVMAVKLKEAKAGKTHVILESNDGTETTSTKTAYISTGLWPIKKAGGVGARTEVANEEYSLDQISIANAAAQNGGAQPAPVVINHPGIANYHINPAVADLEGAKIRFYENDAEVYTRAGTDRIGAKAVSDTYTKAGEGSKWKTNIFNKGILSVPFTVNNDEVWKMFYKWAFNNETYNAQFNTGNPYLKTDNWWNFGYAKYDAYSPEWDADERSWDDYGTSYYWHYDDKGNQVWDPNAAAPLPFLAVEIEKDTTVTSDYAVIVPARINIVALADNAPDETLDEGSFKGKHPATTDNPYNRIGFGLVRENHLYESVGYSNDATMGVSEYDKNSYGAIPMPATHSVAWNSEIDLSKFVETHYDMVSYARYGQSVKDQKMSDDMLEALGLHYEYTAIDYKKGKNTTGESVHIHQKVAGDKTCAIFVPNEVDADGKPLATQNRNTIDREPLIRVDLVTEAGEIVRYGYIKLRIIDTEAENMFVTVDFPDQYMNCGTSVRMTWSQVENLILSHLGSNGMTKQEFEKAYYLEVEGTDGTGYDVMPANISQKFIRNKVTKTAPSGTLYDNAAANKWWAKRYTADYKGYAVGKSKEADALALLNNFTNDNNWFGRVWYTPHDNSTDPQAWDEQTNVLIWDILEAKKGNMNKTRYQKLMNVVGVTYESKGASTKDLSTTVRFKSKTTKQSIFVTLRIPAGKLHFEYGEIGNKNWSHWFEFNSVKTGSPSDASPYWTEFDTRINPYKPSNVNYRFLTVTDFNNMLTDHWMKPGNMLTFHGGDKFTRFEGAAKWDASVDYTLTWPVKDINSTISATKSKIKIDGKDVEINWWKVKGASSDKKGYTEWTLVVGKHGAKWSAGNTAIFAVQKDGKDYASEEVAYLDEGTEASTKNEKLIFHGIETAADLYPAATSLVNYMGAYDEHANPRFSTTSNELTNLTKGYFLEDNIDRAFTAYVKINIGHACYDPLVEKQYFNVRFHRPINVVAKIYDWNDRNLADNTILIKDLVEIVDWNRFPVVPFGVDSKIAARNTEFGIDIPAYATVFGGANKVKQQEYGVPYEFYGIQELAIRYGEIRSDMPKTTDVRSKIYTTADAIISNTEKVKDIPALFSDREAPAGYKTVTLLNANGAVAGFNDNDYNLSNYNAGAPGNTSFGKLYFNNDGSDTQLFHIYLPIAVKYNWGNIAYDKTLGTPAKLDKDYTQVVWAVITVNGTH
jgi:gas vesicle protein